jgi:hypothetical protein
MKSLVATVLIGLASLGVVNSVEAGGHGGHGHGGHGHVRPGHRGFGHRGAFYRRVGYRGFYRAGWARRVWNPGYGLYVYSDPAVQGTYYYDDAEKLYYPIESLADGQVAVKVVAVPKAPAIVEKAR